MKLYKPKELKLIKLQIVQPNRKKKHYLTFEDCTLIEAAEKIKNLIPDKGNSEPVVYLQFRQYRARAAGMRGIGRINGRTKQISIKGYTPEQIKQIIVNHF